MQARPVEPQVWRIPVATAAFYWIREHGPISGVFFNGNVGNVFLCSEEFSPGALTNGELIDRGCILWPANRFIPCTFERVGLLVNQPIMSFGTPNLLLYSRDLIRFPPT